MRVVTTACLLIGALAGAAQLIPVAWSSPPVTGDLVAPPEVTHILRSACYDCHSNETARPWYTAIAPVSWLIHRDVEAGRQRLNFSEWADYLSDPETAAQKLTEIASVMAQGDMAPWYYRLLHPGARLMPEERALLIRWATVETLAQRASR
jgi:hypothetical protein